MKKYLAAMVLLAVFTTACWGARYRHDLLLTGGTTGGGGAGHLNDRGDWVLTGTFGDTWRMYLDGMDYGLRVPGTSSPNPKGLTNNGDVAWTATWNGVTHVFRDEVRLSGLVGVGFKGTQAAGINQFGQVAWSGGYDEGMWIHTYRDTTDYNELYRIGAPMAATAINDLGQVLWESASAGFPYDLWIDGINVTHQILGDGNSYAGKALNNNGTFLWEGNLAAWHGSHVFANLTDLTLTYLHANRASWAIGLNQHDQVLWDWQRPENGAGVVMLDGTDISTAIVGSQISAGGFAVNEAGDVLWASGPPRLATTRVFVNSFEISADALPGTTLPQACPLDINSAGQVLWWAQVGNQYRYYLSTPVPEPSVLALALPVLLLVARPRRTRETV